MSVRLLVSIVGAFLLGCPAAQVKESGGDASVKLRRIEIETASYDEMRLKVVVAVENNSGNTASAKGKAVTAAVLGKAREFRLDDEDEETPAVEPEGEEDVDEAEEVEEEVEEAPAASSDDNLLDDSADATGVAINGLSGKGGSAAVSVDAYDRGEVVLFVTWPIPHEDPAAFARLLSWKSVVIEAKGELEVDGKTFTFGGMRSVRAPNMPAVVLKSAQVASEDGGAHGAAFFDIGIENPNPFKIDVDDFSYALEVGGKVLRPMAGQRETVPPSSVQGFSENYQMTEEEYGKELRTVMRQNTVPYRLWGKLVVRGVEEPFEFTGDMQFPR